MPDSSPEDLKDGEAAKAEAPEVTKTGETVTPAESPPAEAKDDKGDMLAAVKAALKPETEKPSDSEEPGPKAGEEPKPDADKEGAVEGDDSDDLTEDELNRLRPKTRKRIDNLLKDRGERDRKIAEIEPKAQQFEQIAGFVAEAGLSKDEVNDGFAVMRDLKREPYKAYQRLKPIMAQLANMFGEGELPQDLQSDVATGRITEQRARELVNARSQSSVAETQRAEAARQDQERRDREAQQAIVEDVAKTANDWDSQHAKSDLSWKLKQPRVAELVELEVARRQRDNPRYFPTKAETLTFLNSALTKVENDLKAYAPKPRAINPVTDAGSTRSVAKPANAFEAAKLALSQAR